MPNYKFKGDFEALELDGEWLILNQDAYTVTTLNEVGGYCWKMLQEGKDQTDIVQAIRERYEVGEELIQEDLETFFSHLQDCGLVEHAG